MILEEPRWRRSSRSGETNCVEVSHHLDAVRDSKQPSVSLAIDPSRLLDLVKAGRFDR